MKTVAGLAFLGSLFVLAACGGAAQSIETQAPMVTVRFPEGGEQQAQANASDYCDDHYDREAALVSRGVQNGVWVATYQCVPED